MKRTIALLLLVLGLSSTAQAYCPTPSMSPSNPGYAAAWDAWRQCQDTERRLQQLERERERPRYDMGNSYLRGYESGLGSGNVLRPPSCKHCLDLD